MLCGSQPSAGTERAAPAHRLRSEAGALLRPCCVTLGKLFNIADPPFRAAEPRGGALPHSTGLSQFLRTKAHLSVCGPQL